MSNTQYFWSERARLEFAALFDDGSHSASFKEAVATAFAKGWGSNRDKPFWAMSMLVAILGEQASTGGGDEGLDLVWTPAEQIIAQMHEVAQDQENQGRDNPTVVANADGLFLNMPEGRLKLSIMRVAILGKLAEFLLACNEFSYSSEVMETLAQVATKGMSEPSNIKDGGRALARIAYKYRAEHFRDGHSASSFSIIKTYLAKRDNFLIDDDALFAFWVWPQNSHYKTYQAVYFAFTDFEDALKEARIIQASTTTIELDDPVIAGELAKLDEDMYAVVQEELPVKERIKLINESDLKLFKQKEIALLERLLECGSFGLTHGLSSLRLFSFHAIQSGISNGLRTGRSKVPLEQRVLCHEARNYGEMLNEITALKTKSQDWLKVALALRSTNKENEETQAAMQQEGLLILKRSRSNSLSREHDELRPLFADMEESLIKCAQQTGLYEQRLQALFDKDEDHRMEQFEQDKVLFAAEFKRRYLETDMDEI
ncbi:MAG: hypothetical protein L3J67_07480 [Hyphomicrobiaceae bacterium]|nr:hypothetical protein [Hyphomicrobiaceae bacterium]